MKSGCEGRGGLLNTGGPGGPAYGEGVPKLGKELPPKLGGGPIGITGIDCADRNSGGPGVLNPTSPFAAGNPPAHHHTQIVGNSSQQTTKILTQSANIPPTAPQQTRTSLPHQAGAAIKCDQIRANIQKRIKAMRRQPALGWCGPCACP